MTSFVVTIDGPAGAGKSTVARQLATRLGYSFLDTGAIYRTVALVGRQRGIAWTDGEALGALASALDLRFESAGGVNRVIANGADVTTDIRTPAIVRGCLPGLGPSAGARRPAGTAAGHRRARAGGGRGPGHRHGGVPRCPGEVLPDRVAGRAGPAAHAGTDSGGARQRWRPRS